MKKNKGPFLLTPGPLTTSAITKNALNKDWGSRDPAFINLTMNIRKKLLALANAQTVHTCIPIQGSGTFAVEAMLGTLVPKSGNVLALINGSYGERIAKILTLLDRSFATIKVPSNEPLDPFAINNALKSNKDITDVVMVHCETSSGILNPVDEIAAIVSKNKCRLFIDAMSSFGGIPIDAKYITFDGLAASANKCIESVPGVAFVIARKTHLEKCSENSHSLSLDLYDQSKGFQQNGQWRFTPPTQIIAALNSALDQLIEEGGVGFRFARYWENCRVLIAGMKKIGFETYLSDEAQAPIIVTFKTPSDDRFNFEKFYSILAREGYLIYPGKLTALSSFRIGCIGNIKAQDIRTLLTVVSNTLKEMNVTLITNESE